MSKSKTPTSQYYDTAAHKWVINQAQLSGLDVTVDHHATRGFLSRPAHKLWVPPHLDFMPFMWLVSKANLEMHFPGTYNPAPPPQRTGLRLVHGGAEVNR